MWRGADGGAAIVVTIPATGDVPGLVPDCSAGESDRAIADASRAFEDWSRRNLSNRVGLVQKLHDSLMDNQETLARLLTAMQGKPLAEACGEITAGAVRIRWFAEDVRRARGEIVPAPAAGPQFAGYVPRGWRGSDDHAM